MNDGPFPWGVVDMSISKQYLKTRPVSKVTFRLPAEIAAGAGQAALVGEFNGWDPQATRMRRLKSGDFKATVDLEVGREYQYRYLVDGQWADDPQCPLHEPNPFGSVDGVRIVP